jgi:nicotinamidase-related amidase
MNSPEGVAHPTAALLIVDVQEGAVARGPFEVRRVLDNISRLLAACRASGVHVVYVQHDGRPGESEEPHTPGWEIHAGIRPLEDEPVVRKRFNSAFRETQLDTHLRSRGIDTLLITGIQTEYCVDTTIRVAFELGYTILLPELTNTTHDNGGVSARDIYELFNRRIFDGRFASVISLEEALDRVSPQGNRS